MRARITQLALFVFAAILGFAVGRYFSPPPNSHKSLRPITGEATQHLVVSPAFSRVTTVNPRAKDNSATVISQAESGQPDQKQQASVKTIDDLKDWIRRDPVGALKWYTEGGWRAVGDSASQIEGRLREFGSLMAENRSRAVFGQRMAWSSVNGPQPDRLLAQWKTDGGSTVTNKINTASNGADMMWAVAMKNPLQAWSDTAEWVSGLKVDPNEQSALIEQLAQESLKTGEGGQAAVVFGSHQDPVFDRAKAALVVGLAQSSPSLAKAAWDGLSSPAARLSAAIQVLANPKTAPATIQMVGQWAHDSGLQLSGPFQ